MATQGLWLVSISAVIAVLLFDLIWAVLHRHKATSLREAAVWTLFYVSAALIFGFTMQNWGSARSSQEFLAGWITEYSLSIDNLFVFIIILARLQIAKEKEQIGRAHV